MRKQCESMYKMWKMKNVIFTVYAKSNGLTTLAELSGTNLATVFCQLGHSQIPNQSGKLEKFRKMNDIL